MALIGRILMAAAGLAAGLALAEAAVRAYALFDLEQGPRLSLLTSPDRGFPFISYASHPFLPYTGAPSFVSRTFAPTTEGMVELHVANNAYGFRSHELPAEKGPDDYFIVALGESTTWGAGTPTNDGTWPELLEKKLAARYPGRNVRAFNLAVSAATTPYSIVTLALIGMSVQPDLVIAYHGRNDPLAAGATNYRTDHAHYFKDYDPQTAWRGFRRSLPAWVLRSHAVVFVTARLDDWLSVNGLYFHVTYPHRHYWQVVAPDAARKLTENLKTLHAIATAHGAEMLFSTFQLYDPSVIPWPLNDELRAFFAEEGYAYVDQDALIEDFDRSTIYDDCHFTAKGSEAMAQNFYDRIVEMKLLGE